MELEHVGVCTHAPPACHEPPGVHNAQPKAMSAAMFVSSHVMHRCGTVTQRLDWTLYRKGWIPKDGLGVVPFMQKFGPDTPKTWQR
eukprot:scaffold113147_cov18-Tisochrysis_lutea.AAC.1